ncbi:MAG: hypothetical protein IKE69_09425 [Thermoguttaceae bacterium]|nr:hypothetical protein [Thermoguttaceae bacterium]
MKTWRAVCVFCIVCLFLAIAAVGCGRPRPDSRLRIEFLSDITGGENLRLFALHNQGDKPVSFRAFRLKDRQTGESLSADLLKMTHRDIEPGAWEYGIVKQIKDWNADRRNSENLDATVEYTIGKKTCYSTCPITCSQNNRWETHFYPSADLSSFILYLERDADAPISADSVREITINGQAAHIKGFSAIPCEDGRRFFCLELEPSAPLKFGDRVFCRVSFNDRPDVCGSCSKVFLPFVSSITQYGKVIRPVSIEFEKDDVKLNLYNEADYRKCPAVIESVSVDGRDVTADSVLPKDPLPPDLHHYEADIRQLTVRMPGYSKSERHHFEIGFKRLSPLRNERTPGAGYFDPQSFSFDVQYGVPFEIGRPGGWGLEGGAAVYCAGLRPRPELPELIKRCSAVDQAEPPVISYACPSAGIPVTALRLGAACCDFFSIEHPSITEDEDGVEAFFGRFRKNSRALTAPWAASIQNDNDYLPDSRDLQWLAWAAVAAGSHGLFISPSDHGAEERLVSCREEAARIREELRALSPLLGVSQPVPLKIACNQEGIKASALQCGPDSILLVVLNRWCSRASFREDTPFIAAPREGVALTVSCGEDWTPQAAVHPLTRFAFPLEKGSGSATVTLPNFTLFQTVLLTRGGASVSGEPIPGELPAQPVLFRGSPVIPLGKIRRNTVYDIEIPVESRIDTPLVLHPRLSEDIAARGIQIEAPVVTVDPHKTALIRIRYSTATLTPKSVVALEFVSDEIPDFSLPVSITSVVVENARLSVQYVDFGKVPVGQSLVSPEIKLFSENGSALLQTVSPAGNGDVNIEISEDRKSFQFNTAASALGRLEGTIMVVAEDAKSGETEEKTVRFSALAEERITVIPPQITFMRSDAAKTYSVRLEHITGRPLRIDAVSAEAPVSAVIRSSDFTENPSAEITFPADWNPADEVNLEIHGQIQNGEEFVLTLPVTVISMKGGSE